MFRIRELVNGANQPGHTVNSTSEAPVISRTDTLVIVRKS